MQTAAEWRLAGALARLGSIDSVAAASAAAALRLVLAPLRRSNWPDVAWQNSRLTDDGFPVEFSWSSRDASLRWTAEVAGPELPDENRLDVALATVEMLQGNRLDCPSDIRAMFRAITPPHRFGCWLGGRHNALGTHTKIYIELPADLPLAPDMAVLSAFGKRVRWRMLGWDPQTNRRELYGRLPMSDLHEPAVLAQTLGFVMPQRLTDAMTRLLSFRSAARRPLGSESGLSVALSATGTPEALCWFGPARLVHPAPGEVQARLCRAAQGHDTAILTALATPDSPGRIGLVGAGLSALGATWFQAGWRP